MLKRVLPLLIVAICIGCASGGTALSVVPLAGLPPHPVPLCPAAVKVYASPTGVQSKYTELAIVSAVGTGFGVDAQQRALVLKMQEQAAAMGANGVIVGEFRRTGATSTLQSTAIWIPTDSSSAFAACGNRG